jgi:hypothetical protein
MAWFGDLLRGDNGTGSSKGEIYFVFTKSPALNKGRDIAKTLTWLMD